MKANLSPVEICNKIMNLGFSRDQSGTLAGYVYNSLKFGDRTFILLGCRMFKDTRCNKWADQSGLDAELIKLFNL